MLVQLLTKCFAFFSMVKLQNSEINSMNGHKYLFSPRSASKTSSIQKALTTAKKDEKASSRKINTMTYAECFLELRLLNGASTYKIYSAIYRLYTLDQNQMFYKQNKVVLKSFPDAVSSNQDYVQERRALTQLSHPAMIHYLGNASGSAEKYLIFEEMENGSLYDFFNKEKLDWLRDDVILNPIFLSVAKVLAYMHAINWIHCDIKPQNVLINKLYQGKLADFGLACPINEKQQGGSPNFTAPELFRYGYNSKETDVFSFGLMLLEISLSPKTRFKPNDIFRPIILSTEDPIKVVRRLRSDEKTFPVKMKLLINTLVEDKSAPVPIVKVIRGCTQYRPEKRVKMEQVVADLQAYQTSIDLREFKKIEQRKTTVFPSIANLCLIQSSNSSVVNKVDATQNKVGFTPAFKS